MHLTQPNFFSTQTAFPNSKVSPPKRGDKDFMMRSNKLNSALDMLYDQLKRMVDYHWEKLLDQFKRMDYDNCGTVKRADFKVRLGSTTPHPLCSNKLLAPPRLSSHTFFDKLVRHATTRRSYQTLLLHYQERLSPIVTEKPHWGVSIKICMYVCIMKLFAIILKPPFKEKHQCA